MRWEYLDNDVNKSIEVARNPAGVQTLAEVTGGNPWRSAIYRDYMRDHGLEQEMVVALRDDAGQVWGTVRLNRPAAMPAFDEADRQLMRSIAPLLAEGIRRGLLAGPTSTTPSPGSPGLVMVDSAGLPIAVSATAREWLAIFPDGPTSAGGLPLPIHAVSFATLAGGSPAAVLHLRLANGQWAALHGVETEMAQPGSVGVIIGPADHVHPAPLTAAIFGLTPRELQVVELVVRGHATQRMAHMLDISPYTAQEHLRHIFGKVGVASRGELVAALFLE